MIQLLIILAILGFIVWLVRRPETPIAEPFRTAIVFLAIIAAIFFGLNAFGVVDIPLPRFRHG